VAAENDRDLLYSRLFVKRGNEACRDSYNRPEGERVQLRIHRPSTVAAEYEINECLSVFGPINNRGDEQYSEVFDFPALRRTAYAGVKVHF
jgi:hypothetical protein